MSERNRSELPFGSDDPDEQKLWAALGDLPEASPSADLRRGFYRALDQANSESWADRLRDWLGIGSNAGWLTAAACGVIGFGLAGGFSGGEAPGMPDDRLAMLEENVALLNRELILDRLEDANAGTRLKGVFEASEAALNDGQIAEALLMVATEDRVPSIQRAAIDALGPMINAAGVSETLMQLLAQTESPTVQLALVDIVLRNGSREQIDELLAIARSGRLYPDLQRHVMNSIGSESV